MWSLFFDQSFGGGVWALMSGFSVIETHRREMKQSCHPCQEWQSLLDRHGLKIDDISFFSCGVGPGSYTGIRSAAAVAKAVSFATKKPLIAVCSLLLYVPNVEGSYCVVVDAGIGGVFVQNVQVMRGGCQVTDPERVDLESFLKTVPSGVTICTSSFEMISKKVHAVESSSFELEKSGLMTRLHDRATHSSLICQETLPNPTIAAVVANQDWVAGRHYTASTLPLYYLRKTQAEIEAAASVQLKK